jgi:putative salt-induced outer membrane protein
MAFKKQLWLIFLVLTLVSPAAFAHEEEAAAEEKGPWAGNVSLGFLSAKGNTDNESLTFDFGVSYTTGKWMHRLQGNAFGSRDDGTTTSESYKVDWKTAYDFSDRSYAFGAVEYTNDRFSGFQYQAYETAGYGHRVIKTERQDLNLEIGAGLRQSETQRPLNETIDEGVWQLGGEYVLRFGAGAEFSEVLNIFGGSSNTYTESVTKLKASLAGPLALALSYTVRHNSDVPPNTEKSDRFTAISLEYAF